MSPAKNLPGMRLIAGIVILLFASLCMAEPAEPSATAASAAQAPAQLSGLYPLEQGEEALFLRTWLSDQARTSIDLQYFIWYPDNIGTLATARLLEAADRGVAIRVIVDDILLDDTERYLLLLAAHDNVQIRIYNPQLTLGASWSDKIWRIVTGFREVNQRMHNKLVIYDRRIGITGGRNMADEYYDRHLKYNFRDRDMLVTGAAVQNMSTSFEEFWSSPLSVPVETLLAEDHEPPTAEQARAYQRRLADYIADPRHVNEEMAEALAAMEQRGPEILAAQYQGPARFISDMPGKNTGDEGLDGGGITTDILVYLLQQAREKVLIQSPYLIMPEGGLELFAGLVEKGIEVSIQTNSLASTDNPQAFSGYSKQRQALLDAGIRVYESRPHPAIRERLFPRLSGDTKEQPIISLHAKTMVIDGQVLYVGSFNLDPRSANLNTEVGIISYDPALAAATEALIAEEMQPQNSWNAADDPDQHADMGSRLGAWFWSLLPMDPIL